MAPTAPSVSRQDRATLSADRTCDNTTGETTTHLWSWSLVFLYPRPNIKTRRFSMEGSIWLWVGFNVFVLAMLALDLGVFHRKSHAVSGREALIWSVVWISLSLVFNVVIYFFWDRMMPES